MPDIRGEIRHNHEGNPSEASKAQYPKPYFPPPPPPSVILTSGSIGQITEGEPENSLVYTAFAVDSEGSSDDILFTITGGIDAHLFNIHRRNGQVTLSESPDYETKAFYFFTITVSKDLSDFEDAVVDITISVNNIDDTAPVFSASPFYTTPQAVGSTCPIGTNLFTAFATDASDFTDGVITYSANSEYDNAFSINPVTGIVSLASQPGTGSWGTTNSSNILTITASDATGNTASQTIEFVGVVGPSLGTTASAVAESKPAIDADGIVDASDIVHSIVSSGYTRSDLSFEIVSDPSNKFGVVASGADATVGGGIYLLNGQELDHETSTSHDIQIRAVKSDLTGNPGIISPTVTLTIPVTDVQPIITSGGAVASIDENSGANQVIYTATATDADLQSGNITFSLEAGSDSAISIDSSTGEVTLTDDPDYETQNAYSFTVVATNDQSDSASQALTLNIGNTIDIAPTFTSSNVLAFGVAENVAISGIYNISNNIVNPEGASFTLSIANVDTGFSGFEISGINNSLRINSAFDYETDTSHNVTIQMDYTLDDGSTGNTTFVVEVPVANVDEVAPTFTSSAIPGSISENSGANQVVYTATVDDSTDYVSGDVTFAVGPSNIGDNNRFTVDSTTGEVTLTENPDYEAKHSYAFSVVATDAAGNASSKSLLLSIINVADVAPTWNTASVSHTFSESTSSLTTIQDLNSLVTNNDNAPIVYSILSGGSTGVTVFDILGGSLRLNTSFDHENASSHSIVVRMSYTLADGSTGSTNLNVNIAVTDEGIVFNNPNPNLLLVGEGHPATAPIYNPGVVINDPQELAITPNYTLSGPDGSYFNVDASDGRVRFNSSPDYEQKTQYNFILSASLTDYGGQTDTVSSSTVTISVSNNVEDPEFTSATSGVVYERVERNFSYNDIIYVAETILDSSASSVTYTLGGTDSALLSINSSGEVSIIGSTYYSSKSQYDFTVTATDDLGNSTTTGTLSAVILENFFIFDSYYTYRELDEIDVKAEYGQNNSSGLLGALYRLYAIKRNAVGPTSYAHYANTMVTVSCDGDFRGRYSSSDLRLQSKTSDQNNSYYTEGEEYKTDLIVYVNNVDSESYYKSVNLGSTGPNSITATGYPSEDVVYLNTHFDSTLRNSVRIKHSTDTAGISSMATATPTGTECVIHEGNNTSLWNVEDITDNVTQASLGTHAYIINNGNGTISFASSLANANAGVKAAIPSYAAAMGNTSYSRINKVLHKQPHYATAVDNTFEITNTAPVVGFDSSNRLDYLPNASNVDFTFQVNSGSASIDYKMLGVQYWSSFNLAPNYTLTSNNYKLLGNINLAPPSSGNGEITNNIHTDTGLDIVQKVYFNELFACTLEVTDFNYNSAPTQSTSVHHVKAESPDNSSITYGLVSHSGFTFGSGGISINSSSGLLTFPAGITGTGTVTVSAAAAGHVTQEFTITAHEVTTQAIDGNWGNVTMRYNTSEGQNYHFVDVPYSDTFTPGDLYHLMIRGTVANTSNYNRNDVAIGWVQIWDSNGNLSVSLSPDPSNWKTSHVAYGHNTTGLTVSQGKNRALSTPYTRRDEIRNGVPYQSWNHHDNTLTAGTSTSFTGPLNGMGNSVYNTSKMPLIVNTHPRDLDAIQISGAEFLYLESSEFYGSNHAAFLMSDSTFTPPNSGTIRLAVHWYSVGGQTTAQSNNILDVAFAQV